MNSRSRVNQPSSLLRQVEERTQLKRKLEENQKRQNCDKDAQASLAAVSYIPKDCVFNIIIRLPLESLQASRFVCKMWYGIVNTPAFVDAHLRRSDIGLIVLTPVGNGLPSSIVRKTLGSSAVKPPFSVESKASELLSLPTHHWPLIDPPSLFYIKFIEIKDGKSTIKDYNTTCMGKIRATCNGLIILEHYIKKGGLIIMNPVTREMKNMPLGTRSSHHHESYGLAFCHESGVYKVVHLFQDQMRYIGCEIMDIGSGSGRWRAVDGPSFGLFGWLGYQPVFAIGALHWVPNVDHNEYMVSMPLDDEKFVRKPLPSPGGIHDRIFEMGGYLGFVSRQGTSQIFVWILRSLVGEVWEELYTISVDCRQNMVPLCCMGIQSEIIFRSKDDELYAYDHCLQVIRKVELNRECLPLNKCCFPHVNSLVSWRMKMRE